MNNKFNRVHFFYNNKLLKYNKKQKRTIITTNGSYSIILPTVFNMAPYIFCFVTFIIAGLAFDAHNAGGVNNLPEVDHAEDVQGMTATADPDFLDEDDDYRDSGHSNEVENGNINSNSGNSGDTNKVEVENPSNLTSFNTPQDLINNLQYTLDHINGLRRLNMSMLRDAHYVLGHRANVIEHNIPFVENNFPELLNMYTNIITHLHNIYNVANNSLLVAAEGMQDNLANVSENMQDPLDTLAAQIEQELLNLNPEYELESDTDSEKIAEAIQKQSVRYPTTR